MLQLPASSDPDAGQYHTYHMAMRVRLWLGVSQRQKQERRRGQLEYPPTAGKGHGKEGSMTWQDTEPSENILKKQVLPKAPSGQKSIVAYGLKDVSGKEHQMERL